VIGIFALCVGSVQFKTWLVRIWLNVANGWSTVQPPCK